MNFRNTLAAGLSALILGAVLMQTGCASTGNQRSADTRNTMKDVEQDYIDALAQVDVTDGSLQSLIDPGQPDEKKAFDKYVENVAKMEDLGHRLFHRAERMNAQQKDYFEEWRMQGNTYSDPQIQALSEQRRVDLSQYFVDISQASVGVNGSLKAYMADISQIDTYLSTDLTPKGVGAITPTVQVALSDGTHLRDAVAPVLSAISTARAEMAKGGN